MPPWLNTLINTGQGILRTPAAQHMTKAALGVPLINDLVTFMDQDRLSDREKMRADQFGAGDINFSDTENYIGPEMIPGNRPLGFVDGGRDFSEFDQAKMGNPTEEVVRDYLGANPAIRDYEYDTNFYDDPAFGQMSTEMGGSTSYPEKGDFYKEQEFDWNEEIPSLQRRLGNPRFSLGQPQGIESINIEDAPQIKEAIYQDRIMNRNLPGFAYQPKQRLFEKLMSGAQDKLGGAWGKTKELGSRFKEGAAPVFGLASMIGNATNPLNPKAFNYNPGLKEQLDFIDQQFPGMMTNNPSSGLLQYAEGSPLRGQNVMSAFGSNDPIAQLEKQMARHQKTIDKFPDMWGNLFEDDIDAYKKKLEIHQNRLKNTKNMHQELIDNKKARIAERI